MNGEAISSPGLAAPVGTAFELKLRLPTDLAQAVESWAALRLAFDPHGQDGCYQTTSVYCDTPALDVYHRGKGYRSSKYRLRRYGDSSLVYLERKTRRGDRVSKRRVAVEREELSSLAGEATCSGRPTDWFFRRLRSRALAPVCQVVYMRTAFVGGTPEQPLRLTIDRELAGTLVQGWDRLTTRPSNDVRPLLPGATVLELKFRDYLPELFRDLLAWLPSDLGGVSKYRMCVRTWDLVREES